MVAGRLAAGQRLKAASWVPATRNEADESERYTPAPSVFKAVETVTKGVETPLPNGYSFHDKDGVARHEVRVRWWDTDATTYRTASLLPDTVREQLPDTPIPAHTQLAIATDKPLFFGHYWMTGTPRVLAPHAACVDYSAGKGGPLVAYRWDGESKLRDEGFVLAG